MSTGDLDPEGLYHLVDRAGMARYRDLGRIEPPSLAAEGFVHCSWGRQVPGTLARHFAGVDDLVALRLDPDALGVPLVEEDTMGSGQDFPHAYGAIPLAAVRDEVPVAAEPAPAPGAEPGATEPGGGAPRATSTRRVAISLVVLALVYLCVLALGDPRAGSGSDVGGKAATARAVADHGDPDLGYWAAAVDPEGRHHPIVNTEPRTDGTWLQGTSIPFSLATGGLWGLAGAWGAALVPIAGGLLAAWSARRLALRLGATPTAAEAAFWLVGLAGPVGFYALDLWEHAPAAALVLLAASGLVDPRGRIEALVTGLAAGAAVVLRADAALVLVALGVAVLAVGPVRRRWLGHLDRVAVAGIAAVVPLVGNALAERAVIDGDVRGSRAGDLVSGAGSDLAGRLGDAALQLAGPYADDNVAGAIAGLLLAAAAIGLALVAVGRWRAPAPVVRALAVLLGALYLGRIVQGLGFVPGALAVAPLAATGIAAGLWGREVSPERRVVTFGAVGSLPLIWALQWQGNHAAAWGARYLLASAALLVVVGVVALFEDPVPQLYRTAVLGLTVAVGVAGLTYHAVRTRQVADAFDQMSVPADGALVSADVNLLREGGGWYERDARWLTAVDPVGEVLAPGSLGDELGLDTVAVVVRPAAVQGLEETPGWERTDARDLDLPGGRRVLVTLHRTTG